MEKPTHFICGLCGKDWLYAPRRKELYKCECGQVYELVKTRYGWCKAIVGGERSGGIEQSSTKKEGQALQK